MIEEGSLDSVKILQKETQANPDAVLGSLLATQVQRDIAVYSLMISCSPKNQIFSLDPGTGYAKVTLRVSFHQYSVGAHLTFTSFINSATIPPARQYPLGFLNVSLQFRYPSSMERLFCL